MGIYPGRGMDDLPLHAPIVAVCPGLRCTAQNLPGDRIHDIVRSRGWRLVSLGRRGHDKKLLAPRLDFFGNTHDTILQLEWIAQEFPNAPVMLLGISAGCCAVMLALGNIGTRELNPISPNGKAVPHIVAACNWCPGIDLRTCWDAMGDTWEGKCLEKIMYTNLKFTMSDNSDVLKGLDEEAYNACANATSFRQFLDAHHRFAGFATPDLYFKHICPRKKGPFITIPTLMVASADDPICSYNNALEYIQHDLYIFFHAMLYTYFYLITHFLFQEIFSQYRRGDDLLRLPPTLLR